MTSGSTDGEIICTPARAPNANAVAEGWVGTVRRECLDQLLIVGSRQLVRVLRVYVEHDTSAVRTASLGLGTPRAVGAGTWERVLPPQISCAVETSSVD
jgi:putative transposase